MRFRSLILCACMVVVPLLAMFSHHLPPRLAAVVRQRLWEPVVAWAGWSRPRDPAPVAAGPATVPAAATTGGPPAVVPVAVAPPAPTVTPAAQPVPADGRRAVEDRLLRLGARSIECGPLEAGDTTIVASCRVAVDPAGELQRVFQATGPEPTTALARLLGDVEAWRRSIASRPPAASR